MRGESSPDVDWFRALAQRTGGPILELGCGTGRIATPLARDGHDVVGLDRSAAMLERAARRSRTAGVDVRWVEGDMTNFTFDDPFALILVGFNTFLMLTPEERWACLARVREHLTADGRLAIDVFQPDPAKIAGVDGGVVEEWTRIDPETGRSVTKFVSSRANVDQVTFRLRYDETQEDGTIRRWSRAATLHYLYRREAELVFQVAGFHIDMLAGDYEGSEVTPSSPHLLVVARRRERGEGRDRRAP